MSAKRRAVELLAPAGGLEAGLAALQYGADAVYLGLKRFSARADADNFTLDELGSLVSWARGLTPRRRVFVTVNTLVLQSELADAAQALGDLVDLGVDAVIVQDLGVARLVRRHFKELELHASTQLAVHDRAGVEALGRLGFKRITLARELTLEEIRECATVPGVEVECFVHGALCYSYSGLCLFSSHAVGRSGNRGRCAYPCRDRWRVERLCGGELDERQKSGFAFSMKDLAAGDHVGALREAGVACLKIEGRKKSPLYVATTVDLYRRLLDGKLPASERGPLEADLKAVFSRPWTDLYLKSRLEKDVADRELVGHRGTRIGTVERVVRAGKTLSVRLTSSRALARHDGLQIDIPGLDRPFGFAVTDLCPVAAKGEKPQSLMEAPAGSRLDVPLPDNYPTIPEGAAIYCSSSQEVKQRYKVDWPTLKAHRAALGLEIDAVLDARGLEISGRVPARGVRQTTRIQGQFEVAKDPAKMEIAARAAFEKLGDTRFVLARFTFQNVAGCFVPVSRLNEARRVLAAALEEKLREATVRRVEEARGDCRVVPSPVSPAAPTWSLKADQFEALALLGPADFEALEEVVVDISRAPLEGIEAQVRALAERSGRPVRLALPMLARSWEEKALRSKIARLKGAGFLCWEVANVSGFSLLGEGVDLSTDWPVYLLNRLAAQQLSEMGASRFVLSPEDGLGNLRAVLEELGDRATVVVYQDTPLFISESCPYATLKGGCPGPASCDFTEMELSSSYGGKVLAINERCRTFVVNAVPFCPWDRLEALREAGARRFRADFVHRRYQAEEVRDILRKLRSGSQVPGHRGNLERGLD